MKNKKQTWQEKFDELFPELRALKLGLLSDEELVRMAGGETFDTLKYVKQFISDLLAQERKKIIEEFVAGKRCLSCGGIKKGKLTDICDKCLEEN